MKRKGWSSLPNIYRLSKHVFVKKKIEAKIIFINEITVLYVLGKLILLLILKIIKFYPLSHLEQSVQNYFHIYSSICLKITYHSKFIDLTDINFCGIWLKQITRFLFLNQIYSVSVATINIYYLIWKLNAFSFILHGN